MLLDNTAFKIFLLFIIIFALICIMTFAGLTINQLEQKQKQDKLNKGDNTRYAFAVISLIAGIILLIIFTIFLFSYWFKPLKSIRTGFNIQVLKDIIRAYKKDDFSAVEKILREVREEVAKAAAEAAAYQLPVFIN